MARPGEPPWGVDAQGMPPERLRTVSGLTGTVWDR